MSKKLFAIWLFAICIVFASSGCIFNGGDGNKPPGAPSITCPTEAEINEEVAVTVKSFDPDGDEVAYKVCYGDSVDSDWSEYFPSGQEVTFTHRYGEAGDYPIKAVASDRKAIGGWSEEKWIKIKTSQPPPQRVMSILWMGDEQWAELMGGVSVSAMKTLYRDAAETWDVGYGGTHTVGFDPRVRPDWYEGNKVKLITYFKTDDIDYIRSEVRRFKSHPNNGGYWLFSGHEPDITGGDMNIPGTVEAHRQLRIAQYQAIREEDPDAWNHPVVIFYNMTSAFNGYPGWQNAFPMPEEGVDCDVFVIDCYPGRADGSLDYPSMEKGKKLVEIGKSRSEGQFIPNLDADYNRGDKPPPVVLQWEWWNEKFPEIKAVCFWHSGMGTWAIGVYEDEYLQEQVREVNRRLGLLK